MTRASLTTVTLLCIHPAFAAYTNLVADPSGNRLYFQSAGIGYTASPAITVQNGHLVDISSDASIVAMAHSMPVRCPFPSGGSSCALYRKCTEGYFRIVGPGFQHTDPPGGDQRTFVRLSPSGRFLWMEQDSCQPLSTNPNPFQDGLYDTETLRLLANAGPGSVATKRTGRRVITDDGRALTLSNGDLSWISASGSRPIPTSTKVTEAVTTANGDQIAYVSSLDGKIHWLSNGLDRNLNITGSAPLFTPDATALLFLTPEGELHSITNNGAPSRRITSGPIAEFVTTGNVLFSHTFQGPIHRIDLTTGRSQLWVDAPLPLTWPLPPERRPICLACPSNDNNFASPGMWTVLSVQDIPNDTFTARMGRDVLPVQRLSETGIAIRMPSQTLSLGILEVYRQGQGVPALFWVEFRSPYTRCHGILSEDFSTVLTATSTVNRGDLIHVFLSGLENQPLPPLAPNYEADYFGPAPGLIGVQQLTVRSTAPAPAGFLFASTNNSAFCQMPQVR